MDIQKTLKVDRSCYIGETRFCAGIFLSSEIVNRKSYGEHVRLTRYPCYQDAYEEFLRMYGDMLEDKKITPNKLYQVRDKNCYTVFFNHNMVGITYTDFFVENIWAMCRRDASEFLYKHNLCYEDAIAFARERFVRYYGDNRLFIEQGLGINKVSYLY